MAFVSVIKDSFLDLRSWDMVTQAGVGVSCLWVCCVGRRVTGCVCWCVRACAWLVLAVVFACVLGLCDRSVCVSCRVEILCDERKRD